MPEHCCSSNPPFPAHIPISPELDDKGEGLEVSVSLMGPRGNVQGGELLSQERSFLTIRGDAGAPILSKDTKSTNSSGDKSCPFSDAPFLYSVHIFKKNTHFQQRKNQFW